MGELLTSRGAKSDAVRAAIETFAPGYVFAIAELERLCPAVSYAAIRRTLDELRAEGRVDCLGRGRFAQWQKR